MTTQTHVSTASPQAPAHQTVRIRAHHGAVKKLGHWTTARRFDARASRGSVVLDLRRVGRCRVKDWTGTSSPGGRQILLRGEMRARREGRFPTTDDPAR